MISLIAHPRGHSPEAVLAVQAAAVRDNDARLRLHYRLGGTPAGLRIPEPAAPVQTDGLWRHTCFEAFVMADGASRYHELNFSPSTAWAAYGFDSYRARAAFDAASVAPTVVTRRSATEILLDVELALGSLSPTYERAALRVGLSAVVEDDHGGISHWALTHPSAEADFHHPASFALFLEAVAGA